MLNFSYPSQNSIQFPDRTWVIVPAFNEARVIGPILEALSYLGCSVVVVDDGSTDPTESISREYPVHLLRHTINLGQGAAIQTGMDYALERGAQFLVTFDADGQMNPRDIAELCAPLASGKADICLGNRFGGETNRMPLVRRGALKLGAAILRIVSGASVQDIQNGLRAMTRETALQFRLEQNRMAHSLEFLRHFYRLGLRILEIPVTIQYTSYSLRKGQKNRDVIHILWESLFH